MRRWFAAVVLSSFMASGVLAQDPQITVEPAQDDVVVGQPFIIRVKVLVPSFMPKPPVFPTFEVPGLIVRLPERSTQPVSESVDGETWSGVQRTYRIYPMQVGVTEVPVQSISIVYKDPSTNEDVPLSAEVPAIDLVATIPEGARTLDPLIVAPGIEIKQTWQVAEGELAVGDAVTRQLNIAVAGTSALFVPPLLEAATPETGSAAADPLVAGFIGYPEDPLVTESFERGVMSGTRTEEVSYIAQSGGTVTFPEIVLEWYNLNSGTVETITLEGLSVDVAIPPKMREPIDRGAVRRKALLLVLVAGIGWTIYRFFWPLAKLRLELAQERWRSSVLAAHRTVLHQASARDLRGLLAALDQLAARGHKLNPEVDKALKALTRKIYRDGVAAEAEWQSVKHAIRHDRPAIFATRAKASGLPKLNPFT